jgi:uracil-DNA glycosylase family 4
MQQGETVPEKVLQGKQSMKLQSKKQVDRGVLLADLDARVVACERCTRLRSYCATIARVKRRAYREHEYWGKPVPGFGGVDARVLLLGLAPGAHGSNRTGRPFTGDGSGGFLYPLLWESGFASQPNAEGRHDGMRLTDCRINSVVRCAPPENKPNIEELANCAPYLVEELALLKHLRVVVALGRIAFDRYTKYLQGMGTITRRGEYVFSHGAEYAMPDGVWLLGTYHPSLQNTNTGRLTAPMLLQVLHRARTLAGLGA